MDDATGKLLDQGPYASGGGDAEERPSPRRTSGHFLRAAGATTFIRVGEAPPGLHFWGELGTSCECAGCERPARWRPVLLVPLDASEDALAVPLSLAVCGRHRLPKRGWAGLEDAVLLASLEHMASPQRLVMAHAWIEHVPLAWGTEGHPPGP